MTEHPGDEPTTDELGINVMAASPVEGVAPSSFSWLGRLCSEATTFFVTRRFSDAVLLLESGADASLRADEADDDDDDDDVRVEPIYEAPRSLRIRFWSLYVTTLDAVVELGPAKGGETLGRQKWSAVAAKVQSGQIWEEVVRYGYRGEETSVDEEVVVNLATLLLNHAPSQAVNQGRLHSYLFASSKSFKFRRASSASPNFSDDAGKLYQGTPFPSGQPDDDDDDAKLSQPIVLLFEIYALHVLPRNGDWQGARRCLTAADGLDSEVRDHYLEILATLERNKSVSASASASASAQKSKRVKRDKSKIATAPTKRVEPALAAVAAGAATVSGAGHQASTLLGFLRRYVLATTSRFNGKTYAYFRAIIFTIGLLFAIRRVDYRQKVLRLLALCWEKLSGTVMMGVKANYL